MFSFLRLLLLLRECKLICLIFHHFESSMASEKWLKFIEVKQYNLIDYLIALKSEGYVLVGAEQTAYGVQLQKANLPKKMVLIMG